MAKTLRQWMAKPLFVYLLGLYFLIYRTSLCLPAFQAGTFFLLLGAYFLITFILLYLFKLIRLKKQGYFFVFVLWLTVFFFLELNTFLFNLFRFEIHPKALIVLGILIFIARIFIEKKISAASYHRLNRLANTFLLVFSVVVIMNGIATNKKEKRHENFLENEHVALNNGEKRNKDIIWLLLDEYGAPSALKSQFNFDDFLSDSLRQQGFYVYDSLKSRNDSTIYSLSSLFNFDDSINISNSMYADSYLQKSKLGIELEKNNYKFLTIDFLRINQKQPSVPLQNPYPLNYFQQILNNTLFIAYSNRYRNPNIFFDNYNQEIIEKVSAEVAVQSDTPRFIWAHLLIPHNPYCRDAKGNYLPENTNLSDSAISVSRYLNYINYGNTTVLNILKKIPDIKNKTIIISGDHGFRFPCLGDHNPIRKKTFAAIYFPGMDTAELNQIRYLQQIPFHLRF